MFIWEEEEEIPAIIYHYLNKVVVTGSLLSKADPCIFTWQKYLITNNKIGYLSRIC